MTKRIDCYKQGKKVCEIYPAELSDKELTLTLELQAYQGRVCQEKEEGRMTKEEFIDIPLADFAKKLDYPDRMTLAKEKNPEEYKKQILSRVYDLIVKYQEREVKNEKN